MRAVRVDAPIRLDGLLDESLYEDVAPISDFVQVEPSEGAPATEKTDIWLAFDNDNVYVTCRCWDSTPERRVATEMRRDSTATWQGNDVISIFFDTFYDRRNGVGFTINSIGGRNDGQITNENQYAGDWNPIWDFATGRFDGGWTVEMAVPFKSLRYRDSDAQVWGFQAQRAIRWKNELSTITPVPAGRAMMSVWQSSRAATIVGIQTPSGGANLEIKPYVTMNQSTNANIRPHDPGDFDGDFGIDAKYGITQSISADFTYNTDFAQVEADEAQINLTRFSLFFPEKREFFLENQGTFSFGGIATTGQSAGSADAPMLFYSRRIGLDAGRGVPIRVGGRATGRVGRYSLGLLNIQTGDAPEADSGASNFSVVRVKRDILRRSSIGVIATGRSAAELGTGSNLAYGVDGTFGFYSNLAINTFWARTDTDGLDGSDTSYRTQLDYAGDRYGVELEHLTVGDVFNPEVGFARRRDMRRNFGKLRFSPRPESSDWVRRFSWTGSLAYIENLAGHLETREQVGEFAVELQNSDRAYVTYTGTYEFLSRPFDIAENVQLPVGGYSFDAVKVGWDLGQNRRIAGNLAAEYGTFYNGTKTGFSVSRGRTTLGPQLAFEPTYTVNWVDLDQGSFTTHLIGTRAIYTMNPRMFVSSLVQYSSTSGLVGANVRLRWEYQPGSELFIVYNEEQDVRDRLITAAPVRSFIVKVNRLFRF
ncbi:MAG: DUF5916 domain-containing protein [Vicinamibacterales bacterium]